jgi:hypothetical protein
MKLYGLIVKKRCGTTIITWSYSVKIGDLVLDPFGDTAILLSEPHLSEDCMPGGEYYPDATYYEATVFLTEFGCKDVWITDDVEVISEAR